MNNTHYIIQLCSLQNPSIRLDKYLIQLIPFLPISVSRTQLEATLSTIKINGVEVKKSRHVKRGDEVYVELSMDVHTMFNRHIAQNTPDTLPLDKEDILLEDEHILLINKPRGMVVHPGAGNYQNTLSQRVYPYLTSVNKKYFLAHRAGIVHRLDKDTSGVIVVAKTIKAHMILEKLFSSRSIQKKYLAIVHNMPKSKVGIVENYMGRDTKNRKKYMIVQNKEKGRHAYTKYRVLDTQKCASLVLCEPTTGRTHQIRVHMQSIKSSILGDTMYGGETTLRDCTHSISPIPLMLHAYSISFVLKIASQEKEYSCIAPIPYDMQTILDELQFQNITQYLSGV